VVAVVRVDAELVDDLERVFAPVPDIDQGVIERRAVVAGEAVAFAERPGGGEDVRGDDRFQQPVELGIGQSDAIERLEFLAKILLQRGPVVDVGTDDVFEAPQLF
jgi:hypothetical protein